MPSNDEREPVDVIQEARIHNWGGELEDYVLPAQLADGWESALAEVRQLREERDAEKFLHENAMKNLRASAEHVTELMAERDRYAAVIEKALREHSCSSLVDGVELCDDCDQPFPCITNRTLASVDSGSALAERDAEKWDEGEQHESRYLATFGQFCPGKNCNPYRAEQIRKEGKSSEH